MVDEETAAKALLTQLVPIYLNGAHPEPRYFTRAPELNVTKNNAPQAPPLQNTKHV